MNKEASPRTCGRCCYRMDYKTCFLSFGFIGIEKIKKGMIAECDDFKENRLLIDFKEKE